MDNAEQLILPRLPENLESLHKEEEKIRTEALLAINADPALKEHLDMVHASLDTVHAFTLQYQKQTEDELTVQLLGIRLFNASASALALMLAGYYQNSVTMLRDLLETGLLIDYFAIDRPKIQEWRQSNEKERKRKFGPVKIREALDAHDKATGEKRAQIYKLMCNYGAHPTYEGFRLVNPAGLGEIGPFFNRKFLKGLLEELVKHLSYSSWVYAGHFSCASNGLLKGKAEFMNELLVWAKKYLGADIQAFTKRMQP
jgi:hypothetical protein